jgi:large conductance mechanosensitive channel
MNLIKEFKDFITKGNVIDLAIAVIVGAAFTGIVNSLVKDVITPLIALALRPLGGQPDFSKYAIGAHEVVTKDGLKAASCMATFSTPWWAS